MKTYKLKKDLPGIRAGEIIIGKDPKCLIVYGGDIWDTLYMKDYPDWFEEVKEEKPEMIHTPNCRRGEDKNNHHFCKKITWIEGAIGAEEANALCPSCEKSWKEHECPIIHGPIV